MNILNFYLCTCFKLYIYVRVHTVMLKQVYKSLINMYVYVRVHNVALKQGYKSLINMYVHLHINMWRPMHIFCEYVFIYCIYRYLYGNVRIRRLCICMRVYLSIRVRIQLYTKEFNAKFIGPVAS